jgi:DNA-binding transcriptional ArsR family regulator
MENKRKKTHCDRIMNYLEFYPGATSLQMATKLRISNVGARLSELRKAGLIETVRCTQVNAQGETVRFCRYYPAREKSA